MQNGAMHVHKKSNLIQFPIFLQLLLQLNSREEEVKAYDPSFVYLSLIYRNTNIGLAGCGMRDAGWATQSRQDAGYEKSAARGRNTGSNYRVGCGMVLKLIAIYGI